MRPCPVHADVEALTACHSCGRGLCGQCWLHDVNGKPWCDGCVALLDEPVPWVAYLFVAAIAIAGLGLGLRAAPIEPWVYWAIFITGSLSVVIASWKLHGRAVVRRNKFHVQDRAPTSAPPMRSPTPYRGGVRAVRRLAPPVSGALATLIVGSVMLLTAGAIPMLLRLPRWLEVELVVTGWWAIWTLTFTILLYRGWRVASDVRGLASKGDKPKKGKSKTNWGSLDFSGGFDLDGCAVIIGIALALLAAWIIAELFIPAFLVMAYWLVLKGLRSVANDRHECEGRLPVSIVWGLLWATLYTAPIAGLVWLAHWAMTQRA